ncbi:MAG: DUF1566 domain-containing protein [Lentisphaerae bacterium]|nr:DUF1566 domain-containing protein [Lentisphaerota bacterium]MBT5611217.1 DUF1566 domain-containing protein [Lentisphaerota bacterium]MBT7059160.1 DUF1566 domain-containing protein [Lentisphaerota bacterium]MBT7842924.1 DUF1566 domain-containing protein [Lentisphaerota bacterium]
MKTQLIIAAVLAGGIASAATYPIVDTAQVHCYDDRTAIEYPTTGTPYFGQDAQYLANPPSYRVNGDGTVSDNVTGLMWQQNPGNKKTFGEAAGGAPRCRTGGHKDWRLPTIKELYSLIQLNGTDPDPRSTNQSGLVPFIDATVFNFQYGKKEDGDRIIDSQYASSTLYVSTTMGGHKTMFGVNFADGRIKGYPVGNSRRRKTYYVLYVRGNPDYGKNQFKDNADGTITDEATGLTWMEADSGKGMDWPAALEYAENMKLAGHSDWRLPNAKELQSIIDYTRSPDTTGSAAIDPIFDVTGIKNEGGKKDFGHYWTSSSHLRGGGSDTAAYFAFGRSLGFMSSRRTGAKKLMDVHGAGSQRSDPKVGDASRFPEGRGPQGDVIRIQNMVRCVRGGGVQEVKTGPKIEEQPQRRQRGTAGGRQQGRRDGNRQGPPQGGRGGFMKHTDRNVDGKVTKDEFRGPDDHFDHFDKNGDGTITEDEAPTGPPPPGRRR